MNPFALRTWRLGVKSLLLHPLRSLLTVLGIFIGVASVIWLLAIGEGISQKAQEQIASLGAENVIIRSIKPSSESESVGRSGPVPYGITREDYDRLLETIPGLTPDRVVPVREIRERRFRYGGRYIDGRLVGSTPEYVDIARLEIERGHFFSDAEMHARKNHCVLAAEVADKLFPYENPLGRSIQFNSNDAQEEFVVIGVMKPRATSGGIGGSLAAQDYRYDVYIPLDALSDRFDDLVITSRPGTFEGEIVQLSQITLRVPDTKHVVETADVAKDLLDRYHDEKDWAVVVPLELLEQARTTRLMFMAFMGLIAAISLLVGGIGIMNIMLATVTERTREIGIRRALGAKQRDITMQFLVETIVLSIVGGLTGIGIGLTCGPVIRFVRQRFDDWMPETMNNLPEVVRDVSPTLVPWSIPLAFGISVAVGVVFGLYPAMRAARMDPIEALRHE